MTAFVWALGWSMNLRHRDPLSDVTCAECDCGWKSEWMSTEVAATFEAERHHAHCPTAQAGALR